MLETRANRESPSLCSPNNPKQLPKHNAAEFRRYRLLDPLTMSLAILTNMMSALVYYHKHIQNYRVAWLNYPANAYTYTSATMILLAGRYGDPPHTGPLKAFISDVIRHL
jgi:hypothetical protein